MINPFVLCIASPMLRWSAGQLTLSSGSNSGDRRVLFGATLLTLRATPLLQDKN